MSKPVQIRSEAELIKWCLDHNEQCDGFITMGVNGNVRSSKHIFYYHEAGWEVFEGISGEFITIRNWSEMEEWTNIPVAMEKGAFYASS